MIVYLVGIGCVGKTTIGKLLADQLGFSFFDLDNEVESYYNKSIERIQDECFSMNGFRQKASVVLDHLLSNNINTVIAGTPSGLKFSYLDVYKKHKKDKVIYSIFINDALENVLERLTFFDKDSNPIYKKLDDSTKKEYLKELKADFNYFKSSYERADFKIDIRNIQLDNIPNLIVTELKKTERIDLDLPN